MLVPLFFWQWFVIYLFQRVIAWPDILLEKVIFGEEGEEVDMDEDEEEFFEILGFVVPTISLIGIFFAIIN